MSNSVLLGFKAWLNNGPPSGWNTDRRKGRLTSITIHLNELFGDDEGRHAFLKWAFGNEHLSELGDRQLARIWEWLGVRKDDDTGEWAIRAECAKTAALVKRALQIEAGQEELPL